MTSTQLLKPVADGLAKSHPGYSTSDLERAYVAAEKAHSGQLRKSGEPYITHPVAVAQILTELGMDLPTVMAALLKILHTQSTK
jgi:guanosine-3',5'-bis(diphosphate) 3'-pyrophosphohydrolase